ncbi:MAG: DUF2752 domain-containing protein [Clostridia bacterium]|nr:DUF2752 domain-containing protein [Clostridia bacterium]
MIVIGGIYWGITQLTDWYLPCPIRAVTGLCCPGCGISHLITDLLRGDLWSAAQQNLAVAALTPIWLTAGIIYGVRRPAALRQNGMAFRWLTWGSVVVLVAFGIFRNIPLFEFLKPLYLQ